MNCYAWCCFGDRRLCGCEDAQEASDKDDRQTQHVVQPVGYEVGQASVLSACLHAFRRERVDPVRACLVEVVGLRQRFGFCATEGVKGELARVEASTMRDSSSSLAESVRLAV